MAQDKITAILPACIAVWPKVNEVDVFKPKKGAEKRRYTINMEFNDDDHRKVDGWLSKIATSEDVGKNENSPWKKDKKTGKLTLFAFSGEKYKPPMFDAKNNKLPDDVILGGGSKVKVDVTAFPYDGFGGGISLYINAIQVIDLKAGGRAGRFGEEQGFEYEGPSEGKAQSRFDDHTSSDDEDTDDIPF